MRNINKKQAEIEDYSNLNPQDQIKEKANSNSSNNIIEIEKNKKK